MVLRFLPFIFTLFFTVFSFGQTADFIGSPTTICVGGSVTFSDLSVGAASYSWTFVDGGTGQTSSATNPTITYPNPGVFTVILTVANGATSDTEVKAGYITVLAAAASNLTSAIGTDNQTICLGDPITNITYAVDGATGATFSGLPAGVSGAFVAAPTGITVTISGTPGAIGTFPYSFTTTGANCAPITVNGSITVGGNPTISLTSGSTNQTVCLDSLISNIVYTVGGSATGASVIGLPPGVSGSFAGGVLTISGTATATGPFPYTVTTSGGPCPPATLSGTINVEPDIQLISAPGTDNQVACLNTPIVNIDYSTGPSITGATVINLPPGVTGTFVAGSFSISGIPTSSGIFNYTITTSGGNCGPATASGTITVDSLPSLVLDSIGTDFQTICDGSPIVNIPYVFGGSATGAVAIDLPPGVTAILVGDTLTISGTPTATGVFTYTVSTTGSNCGIQSVMGTITIETPPSVTLISALTTDTQEMCLNSVLDSIVYQFSGSVFGTTVLNLLPGINSSVQNDSIIISGIGSTPGIMNYNVVAVGGACPSDTAFGFINVADSVGLSLVSAIGSDNQVVCEGDPIDSVIYVLTGNADTAVVTGLPTGVTSTFSGDSLVFVGTPTDLGLTTFEIVSSGGLCPNDTITGTITVLNVAITLISDPYTNDQTVLLNTPIEPIVYSVGGPVLVSDLPPGVVATYEVGSPNLLTLSGSPTDTGSFFYVIQFASDCGANLLVGSIHVVSDIVPVDVDSTLSDTSNIYVPNLFSPNGDGFNDTWEIPALLLLPDNEVIVINREGQIVFREFEYEGTWDGTYNGKPLPEATYYYVINIEAGAKIVRGPVTILRNEK